MPVPVPIANAYQIDLVHLGVVVVLNLMIGQPTPPSGVVTFLTAQLAGAPLNRVFSEALPFTIALIGVLLLITYVPVAVALVADAADRALDRPARFCDAADASVATPRR